MDAPPRTKASEGGGAEATERVGVPAAARLAQGLVLRRHRVRGTKLVADVTAFQEAQRVVRSGPPWWWLPAS